MYNKNNPLTIKTPTSVDPVPADQNPVVFKNVANLKNFALKFTTSYPQDTHFIPDLSLGQNTKITNHNTITNISATRGWDNSITCSKTPIAEGRVYLNIGQTNQRVIFGFTPDYWTTAYKVITFGIFATNTGEIQILENSKFIPGFGKYTTKDVLAVERHGNTIAYSKNSVVFYVSTITSVKTMHFCVAFEEPGAFVSNVYQRNFIPTNQKTFIVTKFTGLNYKLVNQNSLISTAKEEWNSFAYGEQPLVGVTVVTSARMGQTDKYVLLGVTHAPKTGTTPPDHNYINGIVTTSTGKILFMEGRPHPIDLHTSYTQNDVLSMVSDNSTTKLLKLVFLKNNIPFFATAITSPNPASRTLIMLRTKDTTITNIVSSQTTPGSSFFNIQNINGINFNTKTSEVSYNNVVVATVNQNRMPKFTQSTNYVVINYNTVLSLTNNCIFTAASSFTNGGVFYQAGQTNSTVTVYLTASKTEQYGLQTNKSGNIAIVENGKTLKEYGQYTTDDTLSIAANFGVVTYSKNGTVFYTSTIQPTGKLLLTANIENNKASITELRTRIFNNTNDTNGFYIMFNDKASISAVDNIAIAVSTGSVVDSTAQVKVLYTPSLIYALS